MKKIIFSLATSALIFAGCSHKAPELTNAEIDKNEDINIRPIYFDFDKYNIRDDQWGQTIENSKVLNQGDIQGQTFTLEGHADHWGTDEYNYALGVKRAKAVKDQMVEEGSVNADRIYILSYGETKPVCTETTKECDEKNRRVETVINGAF